MYRTYALIEPAYVPMPDVDSFQILEVSSCEQIEAALGEFDGSEFVALDFETRGTRPWRYGQYVVGVALSNGDVTKYLAFPSEDEETCLRLTMDLAQALGRTGLKLIAHNVYYDARWMTWLPNWTYCTYHLMRTFASEGWKDQRYDLKTAQVDLLGWDVKGSDATDQWLVDNEFTVGAQAKKPDRSQLWRVPVPLLGHYACLDAYSTFQLFDQVLRPRLDRPECEAFREYCKDFMQLVRACIESLIHGMRVDRKGLISWQHELEAGLLEGQQKFHAHPDVVAFGSLLLKEDLQAYLTTKKEPPKMTKAGKPSKNWEKWAMKRDEKCSLIFEHEQEPKPILNPRSGYQLRRFFYEFLGHEVLVRTKPSAKAPQGSPSTGKKALPYLGDAALLLKAVKDCVKELEYVEKCELVTREDSRIHPEFRVPGTHTGRLAGAGGFSVHQQPKSTGYLRNWIPDEGRVWISQDFSALEQVVLAEFSGDAALLSLYGPDAPKNDVYLYVGASLPGIGDAIRAAGYDPDAPTPEGIANAKVKCKKERNISKVVVLSMSYGAGVRSLHLSLRLMGVDISEYQTKKLHQAYWRLFSGVKSYYGELEVEWKRRGYLFSGLGEPIAIDMGMRKDLGNRVVQRSGHSALVKYVSLLQGKRDRGECPPFTWIIPDFHDEVLVQCLPEDSGALIACMNETLEHDLNEVLAPVHTRLKGEAELIENFAYAKVDREEIEEFLSQQEDDE